jgi:hypothetical protein
MAYFEYLTPDHCTYPLFPLRDNPDVCSLTIESNAPGEFLGLQAVGVSWSILLLLFVAMDQCVALKSHDGKWINPLHTFKTRMMLAIGFLCLINLCRSVDLLGSGAVYPAQLALVLNQIPLLVSFVAALAHLISVSHASSRTRRWLLTAAVAGIPIVEVLLFLGDGVPVTGVSTFIVRVTVAAAAALSVSVTCFALGAVARFQQRSRTSSRQINASLPQAKFVPTQTDVSSMTGGTLSNAHGSALQSAPENLRTFSGGVRGAGAGNPVLLSSDSRAAISGGNATFDTAGDAGFALWSQVVLPEEPLSTFDSSAIAHSEIGSSGTAVEEGALPTDATLAAHSQPAQQPLYNFRLAAPSCDSIRSQRSLSGDCLGRPEPRPHVATPPRSRSSVATTQLLPEAGRRTVVKSLHALWIDLSAHLLVGFFGCSFVAWAVEAGTSSNTRPPCLCISLVLPRTLWFTLEMMLSFWIVPPCLFFMTTTGAFVQFVRSVVLCFRNVRKGRARIAPLTGSPYLPRQSAAAGMVNAAIAADAPVHCTVTNAMLSRAAPEISEDLSDRYPTDNSDAWIVSVGHGAQRDVVDAAASSRLSVIPEVDGRESSEGSRSTMSGSLHRPG